jgi:hypothetical protein
LELLVSHNDDPLTIVAIASLACILQDLLHEGLGHALTAWLSGAQAITISTVALQSDISTRWISASGTLVNIIAGAVLWSALRSRRLQPATRYFLALAMAGNLFTGTGYFLFSGILNFGDWAAVIRGLEPHVAWRLGLIVVGVLSYVGSMRLAARELQPFMRPEPGRLRRLCFTPYITDGVLAGVAGLLNPLGAFYVIASALPSTLGANAALLALPSTMRGLPVPDRAVETIERKPTWIAAAVVAVLWFVFVLGRSVTLR